MTERQLRKTIDEAERHELKKLELRDEEIGDLPSEIGKLRYLEELDLQGNHLCRLPVEIRNLTNLHTLKLGGNEFTVFPPKILGLLNLSRLFLDHNQIQELPSKIEDLDKLVVLDISYNKLKTIPDTISGLRLLSELYLQSNQLRELPREIGRLKRVLTKLHLQSNQLRGLPSEIGKLQYLKELYVQGNYLETLPVASFKKLKNLKLFDLQDNPLPIPPEIAAHVKEPSLIINYALEHFSETAQKELLYEAKMLVVGQSTVGKTQVVNRLLGKNFQPDPPQTEGLEIHPWQIEMEEKEIQVNIWDFGGQEIYHATHQFFLSKRSLYLLVWDAMQEDTYGMIMEYWLKHIQTFGGNSPVIVVINKIDLKRSELNRHKLMQKYPNIKEFVSVSCKTDENITLLKKSIQKHITQLPHIDDQLLVPWLKVKLKLKKKVEERNYLDYQEYIELCQEQELDTQAQETLISFLHDLGVILNFREDIHLRSMILNPKWVTEGVYQILSYKPLKEDGILTVSMLEEILDTKTYPPHKYYVLLDMMRKFELCFEFVGEDRYLIPQLLSPIKPHFEWNEENNLMFQYQYDFLPLGIMSRFIVQMNFFIFENTYWKNGVVIADSKNKALVQAEPYKRKISISVNSNKATQREFLSKIRGHFEQIHSTVSQLRVEEKVPLPDKPSVVVDYNSLLQLESMGEKTFLPEGYDKLVSVKSLLDGVGRRENVSKKMSADEEHYERLYQEIWQLEEKILREEIWLKRLELERKKKEREREFRELKQRFHLPLHSTKDNNDFLREGLKIFHRAMLTFIKRQLQQEYGEDNWLNGIKMAIGKEEAAKLRERIDKRYQNLKLVNPPENTEDEIVDFGYFSTIILRNWDQCFRAVLIHKNETEMWLKQITNIRNYIAHSWNTPLSHDDTWEAFNTLTRLLRLIDNTAAEQIADIKQQWLQIAYRQIPNLEEPRYQKIFDESKKDKEERLAKSPDKVTIEQKGWKEYELSHTITWEGIRTKVGKLTVGTIDNIHPHYGVFVKLSRDFKGLIPRSNLPPDFAKNFLKGQSLLVRIENATINAKKKNKKEISLSLYGDAGHSRPEASYRQKTRNQSNSYVEIILRGHEFNDAKCDDLVVSIATLLNMNRQFIRILEVRSGSVRVTIELPTDLAKQFIALFYAKDIRFEELLGHFFIESINMLNNPEKPPRILQNTFNWLHLTDLHQGMKHQKWLWPNVRQLFFDDLKKLREKCDPWDLVVFTGDLTQTGTTEEFQKLDALLEQLWKRFEKLGTSPQLLVVPGNHDLVRPDPKDPPVRLLQQWSQHPDIREDFWEKPDCPYRQIVSRAFESYVKWFQQNPFTIKNVRSGILPGDFSATFEKDGAKLGILGLNTSFLQLTNADYEGKLALHARQFHAACGGGDENVDGVEWIQQHHACLLLTHHPPLWLDVDSQQHLEREINAYGRFAVHLCGHMHEPVYYTIAKGGTEVRRLWQGRSLFGLEYYGNESNMERTHGYSIGRIELSGDNGKLNFWPRTTCLQGGSQRKFIPDHELAFLPDDQRTSEESFKLIQPYPATK